MAQRQAITIGGRPLEVVELGGERDAAAIVLLHEGLGSAGLWRGFPAALAEATDRRVIAFSRFGHGRSGLPPRPRTPRFFHEEALEVLPELLDELEIECPLLVGHSDGASIALIHAAHHDVAGLVLMAPHVFVEPATVAAIRGTRRAFVSGELRGRMARHHDDPDAAFWGWCDVWLAPEFSAWTLDAEAAQLDAPVLLVQGADDPYGTLEQLDRIERVARAPVRRLIVPGGHSPHLEQPDAVVAAIREFAAGLA